MDDLKGLRASVVGAGAVGLCVAMELQSRGAGVTLVDEAAGPLSASAVAAGMLAPAFEAALEERGRGRLPLLRAGRDLWQELAGAGVEINRAGALWAASPDGEEELARIAAVLDAEGAERQRLTVPEVRARSPALRGELAGAVFSPEDWRLDPHQAMAALGQAFVRAGGLRRRAKVTDPARETKHADALVLCAGWASHRFRSSAGELGVLRPIKGELIRFPDASIEGPVVRTSRGYLVPGRSGLVVGATMAEGADDMRATPETGEAFAQLATSLFPSLTGAGLETRVGVRAATPDGLPLVGRSEGGVYMAAGFRRNGWLLAPLAARVLADQLAGREANAWAEAFRPNRFEFRAVL